MNARDSIKTPWALLTLTGDGWNINAGVDESNANNKIILIPKNSFQVAESLLLKLRRKFSITKLGILITDTKSVPLRVGTIGRAVAYAGLEPIKSYIAKKDLFGRKSRFTDSNIADSLTAIAVLVMREGSEQTPLVILRNTRIRFSSKKIRKELSFPPQKDIFAAIYKNRRNDPVIRISETCS